MSEQRVGTPREFLDAVEARFGRISLDVAADSELHVCEHWWGPGSATVQDALYTWWPDYDGALWCNPPFAKIKQWAARCHERRSNRDWTLLLVPASTDAYWYLSYVHHKAFVMPLIGRIKFIGHDHAYPKPLMLCAYGYGVSGFEPWDWRR